MSHRLFHSLVLSSVAILDGCATAPPPPSATVPATSTATAPATDTPTAAAIAATPPIAEEPIPPPVRALSQRSEAEVRAMVADARTCEPGWPTTKSAHLYPPQTVTLNGRTYACVLRPDRADDCCVHAPRP